MKVLFDANVLLSYMLAPGEDRTITRIVDAAFEADSVEVGVPPDLLDEILNKALAKPYFQARIFRTTLEATLTHLVTKGELLDEIQGEYAAYARDSKDDYLVVYGLLYSAHFLVTGDGRFRGIYEIEGLRILSPVAFHQELGAQNLI